MWTAPKLKELNASFNLLKDLPNYLTAKMQLAKSSGEFSFGGSYDLGADSLTSAGTLADAAKTASSLADDDSLDDARMMRSIQLATINITVQELDHHRFHLFNQFGG